MAVVEHRAIFFTTNFVNDSQDMIRSSQKVLTTAMFGFTLVAG